jgi:hypothetical protein
MYSDPRIWTEWSSGWDPHSAAGMSGPNVQLPPIASYGSNESHRAGIREPEIGESLKGLKRNQMVKLIVRGRLLTTRMQTNQLKLISELNQRRSGLVGLTRKCDTWVFYQGMNRVPIMDLMPPDQFVHLAVPIPQEGASQLFGVPHFKRSADSTSQDLRDEPQVILKPYDLAALNTKLAMPRI